MHSFFPRDVLDEIWNLIESVSEGFPIYLLLCLRRFNNTSEFFQIKSRLVYLITRDVAAVKRLLIPYRHNHSADYRYIYWPFGITEFVMTYFEKKISCKPVLRGQCYTFLS